MKQFSWILVFLVLNFSALGIGSWLMNNGPTSNWYIELKKAPWSPPGWVFGVAWTLIMICFSIYLSYLVTLKPKTLFWVLFFVQFLLNVCWNYAFFNQHSIVGGLLIIIALTIVVSCFLIYFSSDITQKSWLIAPYLIWLFLATSLNAYIYINN